MQRIENIGTGNYTIITPEMSSKCQEEQLRLKGHESNLQCGRIGIRVGYPEIYDQTTANGAGYVVIPEFMIPGRRYPIYIYLYAIAIYCINPMMGQREAAKRTRERFGLETFSHTTLGRAMKKLEEVIKGHENEPHDIETAIRGGEDEAGTFPSVNQTKERKEKVASYLKEASAGDISLTQEARQPCKQPNYKKPPYEGAFINACHNIVRYTFLKYHRLLL